MKKFWMVLKDGSNHFSVKRHDTQVEACAEAERLARKESAMFFVMEAIGSVISTERPVVWDTPYEKPKI